MTTDFNQGIPEDGYRILYGDFRTGRLAGALPVTGATFQSAVGEHDDIKVTISAGPRAAELFTALAVGKALIAVEWTGGRRVLAAGRAQPKALKVNAFEVSAPGIGTLYERRVVNTNTTYPNRADGAILLSDLDLGSIARQLINNATYALPGYDLPVLLEPLRAGTHARTYWDYELAWVWQRITELTEVDGGPEVAFRPRLKPTDARFLEWQFVTGTQDRPQLRSDALHVIDGTAAGQQVLGELTTNIDSSALATRAWCKGDGTERATVIGIAEYLNLLLQGYPATETQTTSNTTSQDQADRIARGQLNRTYLPLRSVQVPVRATTWWQKNPLLGDQVTVKGVHPVLGKYDLTSRVLGWSGDVATDWVTLSLADTFAETGWL